MKKLPFILAYFIYCPALFSQNVLDQDDVHFVDSAGSNSIYFHTNMSLIDEGYYDEIVHNIKKGLDSTSNYIQVENVEFRVLVFPERTIPRIGMSGVAPNERQIYILLDDNHPKLDEAINKHIYETIPHEYHHTMRYRTIGFGQNLFESLISEGLACHFAMQVCNIDPPKYCVAYDEETLNEWTLTAEKEWFNEEFDYYDWFVGRDKPRNIGYAIGFRLVQDYLDKHPGETAASLHSIKAINFLPVD